MTLTTVERCFLCRRPDDYAGVLVTLDGAVRLVCDRCVDEVRIPLDMTDEGDE